MRYGTYADGTPMMVAPQTRQPFGVSQDPLQAQKYKTQRANQPEDYYQPLYDRSNVATAVPTQVSFFATPRGQSATLLTTTAAAAAKVKTYRDTNMDSASVATTKLYKIVGISMAFFHQTKGLVTNSADREVITNGGYLQFRVVDKDILYLPLVMIPEVNPVMALSTTANATSVAGVGSGGGPGIPMFKLAIPVTINPFENFTFNFNFDTTTALAATMDVLIVLHAYMRRPS